MPFCASAFRRHELFPVEPLGDFRGCRCSEDGKGSVLEPSACVTSTPQGNVVLRLGMDYFAQSEHSPLSKVDWTMKRVEGFLQLQVVEQ